MISSLSISAEKLIRDIRLRDETFYRDPAAIYSWWWVCPVNVLIVADGPLTFGMDDFGLRTFVNTLLDDNPTYARFNITLAHLRSNATGEDIMAGSSKIARSINDFRFDEDDHFTPDKYDQIWLFGFETAYTFPKDYKSRAENRLAGGKRYPLERLGDEELRRISAHMKREGGVFATGDHAKLGKALCGSVNRVRGMRHWDSFPSGAQPVDQVSMVGPLRNDTNQIGHHAGSQFSDQSDDVPQIVDVKRYRSRLNLFQNARYPHPVLCGRTGVIDVLPDHPHEGECIGKPDINLFSVYELDEFNRNIPRRRAEPDGSGRISSLPVMCGQATWLVPQLPYHQRTRQ